MNTQPEALRLAELLERLADEGPNWQVLELAAAELRRLHTLNAGLLEELENCVDLLVMCFSDAPVDSCIGAAIKTGNAAIAKAEGEQV